MCACCILTASTLCSMFTMENDSVRDLWRSPRPSRQLRVRAKLASLERKLAKAASDGGDTPRPPRAPPAGTRHGHARDTHRFSATPAPSPLTRACECAEKPLMLSLVLAFHVAKCWERLFLIGRSIPAPLPRTRQALFAPRHAAASTAAASLGLQVLRPPPPGAPLARAQWRLFGSWGISLFGSQ
jgi:hypothetical protein